MNSYFNLMDNHGLEFHISPSKSHLHSFFEYLVHPIMHHWGYRVFSHDALQPCRVPVQAGVQRVQMDCPPEGGTNMIY